MIVYKYKSLGESLCSLEQEKQIGYLKDICLNNHLYAAHFNVLDDPMEGVFKSNLEEGNNIIKEIYYGKDNTRICSLSPTYQSMLMWSFYADEHKGCCIEVEIPHNHNNIKEVNYVDNPFDIDTINSRQENRIESILLRKYKDWAFEKELRVLTKEEYVKVDVKKVYLGIRASDKLVEKLKADILSWNKDINVVKMREDMFVHINTTCNNNQI